MEKNILTDKERKFWRPLILAWRQDLRALEDGSYTIPHELLSLSPRKGRPLKAFGQRDANND